MGFINRSAETRELTPWADTAVATRQATVNVNALMKIICRRVLDTPAVAWWAAHLSWR